MYIMGIDPGKAGAVALLFDDGSLDVFDLGECYDASGAAHTSINPILLQDWLLRRMSGLDAAAFTVCCEKPIFVGGGFTIRTPMSMFESYGVIRGVCLSLGLEFFGVSPKDWQKHFPELYHPRVKRTKEESVQMAKELFPDYAEVFESKVTRGKYKGGTVLLDGRAEAALIAKYARDELDVLRVESLSN